MTSAPAEIHPSFITTLDAVPAYPTVRALGLVAGVGTGSGKVARNKGLQAYAEAIEQMSNAAAGYGANAIVGVTVSNFGSSIGGAFGDAVGVTLLGTAVIIKTE